MSGDQPPATAKQTLPNPTLDRTKTPYDVTIVEVSGRPRDLGFRMTGAAPTDDQEKLKRELEGIIRQLRDMSIDDDKLTEMMHELLGIAIEGIAHL